MGLAASQARLLSITSRMADNELRSQLINNAKMRLTTESSKVSDEYIAALNKTQLMMSNYNLLGESQYQDLTFNSLTAYSPLNNQYGLVNKSGELLVSELDTARYEEAFKKASEDKEIEEGDTEGLNAKALEEFLKSYGLEKTTTYFEQDQVYAFEKDLQRIWEGDMVYEYIPATEQNPTPEVIRVSGLHYGYEKSKTSVEYGVYEALLTEYQAADSAYTAAVKDFMKDYVYTATDGSGKQYQDLYKDLMAGGGATVDNYQSYQDSMGEIWNKIKGMLNEQSSKVFAAQMEEYLSLQAGQVTKDETSPAPNRGFTTSAEYIEAGAKVDLINKTITWPADVDAEEKAPTQTGTLDKIDLTSGPFTEIIETEIAEEDMPDYVTEMYKYFQSGIMGALDRDKILDQAGGAGSESAKAALAAQDRYYVASKQLSQFIYGQDVGAKYYDMLDDMEWILYGDYNKNENGDADPSLGRTNAPYFPTTALDGSEGGVEGEYVKISTGKDEDGDGEIDMEDKEYYCNFQAIIDVYLCEKAIELYGTPKYTWVDVNDPDSDGEAKAKWYTNLFQRMLEGGYQTIEKGLASSQEWLQYALESSLVSMEQVNADDMWVSTMYTNCSDITESTVDVDITLAEAEYTKKMNAIQAKDKRYDIELKNIDTEHNSLQTEYDSIKSVMDKNVERNFKMFEA